MSGGLSYEGDDGDYCERFIVLCDGSGFGSSGSNGREFDGSGFEGSEYGGGGLDGGSGIGAFGVRL
jgi:hypothetical protein